MKKSNLSYVIGVMLIIFILPVFSFGQAITANLNGRQHIQETLEHNGSNEMNIPMGVMEDTAWLHYDDTEMSDAWGFLIAGEEYDVVSKWDAADLSDYDGWVITKIKFIVVSDLPYLKVKVWEGPNTTEIYSQDVPSYNVNSWTEVILDTEVEFDADQELWVGYYVDMTHTELGGFVTATDDGPPVDEYGNLYRYNGTWYSDFNNHNLQVFIEANLDADFEADNTVICMGSTVNFANLSSSEETYDWTFEGGTPATSTDENPSVVYNTPGVYDVTLEVSLGDETDTEYKQDYIHVLDTPGQADVPDGESSVCTEQFYVYSTNPVLYAQDYEWELSPANAGILTPSDTSANLAVADDWTGDFIIRVRATNMCGDGDWSDEFEGTVYQSPSAFNLEGGGGYCLNGDGVEITLDGSETDVDYELYLDGVATANIVAGTGSEISFGMITDEGHYTAIASNANCDFLMNEQIQVEILFPPLEPETPTGPEMVCNDETSDYESDGTPDADSYEWTLTPEDAGVLTSDGLTATVVWSSDFSGIAEVSLYGINDCGDGNPSNVLEVTVDAIPMPEVNGPNEVCDNTAEAYSTEEIEDAAYTWEVSGGTISDGQGTNSITVDWGGAGDGVINVSVETAAGCVGDSETFDVFIDDCTGIGENSLKSSVTINPNPARDFVIIKAKTELEKISILNITGEEVMIMVVHGKSSKLNTTSLIPGVYLINIQTAEGVITKKLLIR